MKTVLLVGMTVLGAADLFGAEPLVRSVDLNVGESATVTLSDGSAAQVRLLDLAEELDSVNSAVRQAKVLVEINGEKATLVSATYHLPTKVGGTQVDCSITKGYNARGSPWRWGLDKDARLRLWPGDSPLIRPGTFVYPAKQKWFATDTQMANVPVFVNGVNPKNKIIYYHSGLDIGGSEGLIEIVSATDGLVVSAKGSALDGYKEDTPVAPRYDKVYILDERGWYYLYSHMKTVDDAIRPGRKVKKGDRIGWLGKEGGSGGWSHLHFEIISRQPSGKWGTQEGYAFLWEAYLEEYQPKVIAVARPHHLIWSGESVTLDASKSWSASGKIASYEWQFEDGTTCSGPTVERTYKVPGRHSEILKVTDAEGNVSYDFAIVLVCDKEHPERIPPLIHPTYASTFDIHAGDEVTFTVRSFNNKTHGKEIWDFGDGTAKVEVLSDGNSVKLAPDGYAETTHAFEKPGDYIVRVERINEHGAKASGNLWVRVEPSVSKNSSASVSQESPSQLLTVRLSTYTSPRVRR